MTDSMIQVTNQVSALWRYLPVAEPEDRHSDFRTETASGSGTVRYVAGTVRGKQHKHNGTNCDDWFEIRSSGPWMFAAVADGAGSCRLSRIGARISTGAAMESLTASLENVRIGETNSDAELQRIQQALGQAAHDARLAVLREAARRACDPALLSATLLLAAYCDCGDEGLAVTWQVGDGLIAAITRCGEVCQLNKADSGSYAGETNFLPFLEDPSRREARVFRGTIRCLLIMTDGVADDYFPPKTGVPLLEADLMLNGILPPLSAQPADLSISLADFEYESAVLLEGGPVPVHVRSAAALADALQQNEAGIASSPELTAAARLAAKDPEASNAERLGLWLGAYQVRGSSDDRTLVALYRRVEAPV